MASLFDFRKLKVQTARYGVSVTGSVAKRYLRLFGIFVIAPLVALMDEWDYLLNRSRITGQYTKEIATILGKDPKDVDVKDLKAIAEENPTLGEALKRAKRRRNVDMAINVCTSVATFFIIAALLPHLAVPTILITGAIGLGGFVLSNYILEKIGNKIFHLSEPSLKKVERNPDLQHKLSVPSQVNYLDHLQKKRLPISSTQITTLFEKAEREISPMAAQTWANKLNEGLIDATEMAFIVYGQRSGVPERESRELTQLEHMNAVLMEDLAIARAKLRDAGGAAANRAGVVRDRAADLWQTKVRRRNTNPEQSHAEAVLAEREMQAQSTTPPL